MSEISWIKLSTSIFDNRKIKQIRTFPEGDSLLVIWLQLLCLAGVTNDGGRIYLTNEIPYTEQMLATAFGEPLATVQLAMRTFENFGMIEVIDDIILIANWEKYQAIEGMEKIREQSKIRMRNYRERQKQIECDVTVTQPLRTVTQENKNKSKNKKEDTTSSSVRFTPPTLEELDKYCWEKGYQFNTMKFISYYESNGWKVGRNKMKSWKATADRWAMEERPKPKGYNSDYQPAAEEKPKESEETIRERLLGISAAKPLG